MNSTKIIALLRIAAIALSARLVPAAFAACPDADLNRDCRVGFEDVVVFAQQWLIPTDDAGAVADMDGNGEVESDDFVLLAGQWRQNHVPVVINEVLAANAASIRDPQGDYEDWIELYNAGDAPINVGGMYLTDDFDLPAKWQIPRTPSSATIIIPAKGYLLIWADEDVAAPGLHANFKLDTQSGHIGLFAADGKTVIDSISYENQTADVSYGLYPDAGRELRFFGYPTPGAANNAGFLDSVAEPRLSHERGFYDKPFMLTLSCDTPDAKLYYSADGRLPNDSTYRFWPGKLYTEPITVSHTTCLRVMAIKPGWKPSAVCTSTYVLDTSTAVRSLPLISLVGDPGKVFYEPNGVMAIVGGTYNGGVWTPGGTGTYNNALKRGYEKPVSFEWIEPQESSGLQVDCGLRVHGSDYIRPRYIRAAGYWQGDAKYSFRLYFRGIYGPSRLEYPLFPFEVERFKDIVLRGGHNDRVNPFIKDELLRRLHKDMGQVAASGTFANLFINGEYKGYYNPTEHITDSFCQEWFGSDQPWDVMTMNGIRDGNPTAWNNLLSYLSSHNLANSSYYQYVAGQVDLVSYIDYLIVELWASNWDWPNNNWCAARERSQKGQWKFFIWDAEGTMESGGLNIVGFDKYPSWQSGGGRGLNGESTPLAQLYRALKVNPDFRRLFGDRLDKHFNNGGALMEPNIRRQFEQMRNMLRSVIPNMDAYIINTWVPNRLSIFLNACKAEGVYTFAGPVFAVNGSYQQGGQVSPGSLLAIATSLAGAPVYYTLDGTDPIRAGAKLYTGPITLSKTTQVKARVLSGTTWSALNEAVFAVGPVAESLRITEIMYHPLETVDSSEPNVEYIELKNIGGQTINLNLVKFTNGIDFTFGDIDLAPNKYILVARDLSAFTAKYGQGLPIAGVYTGSLDNAGEKIELQDAAGKLTHSFKYADNWYEIADGMGFSITVKDPANIPVEPNSLSDKSLWRPSASIGGSPGIDDTGSIPELGDIVINEIMAHSHAAGADWIELYNATNKTINIAGWFLSDDQDNLTKYQIAQGSVIGPYGYKVFYEHETFNNLADPGCIVPFALSENGEMLCLQSGFNGVLTGYSEQEKFDASETGVSMGRYLKSTGAYNFVALQTPTPNAGNSYPKVGPVVINEIMYHPDVIDDAEYVELLNISNSAVRLYDEVIGEPWRFTDDPDNPGIDFRFPKDSPVTLNAGEHLLLIKDLTLFSSKYTVPAGVKVYSWGGGKLDNAGEKIQLSKPGDIGDPPLGGLDAQGTRYWIRVDRVVYSDGGHPGGESGATDSWPIDADGLGKSLSRKYPDRYGNDPNNWQAATPTPGKANP